jgi:tetratricopeptide (TPR) repeat protein
MNRRTVCVLAFLLVAAPLHAAAPPPRQAFAQADLRQAHRLANEAYEHAQAGRFAQAQRCDSEALALRRRWLGGKHYAVQESLASVERWRRLADVPAGKQEELGAALRSEGQGNRLLRPGRYREAEKAYRQALAIFKEALGEQHPSTATSYNNVAFCLQEQGKAAQALPLHEKALAIRKEALGERHPRTTDSYDNVAACLEALGKAAQALPLFQKTLAIRKAALGERHPDTAQSYGNVAYCLQAQGKTAQALPLHEKALAIWRKALGERHPRTASGYDNAASCLQAQGKAAQAHHGRRGRSRPGSVMPGINRQRG